MDYWSIAGAGSSVNDTRGVILFNISRIFSIDRAIAVLIILVDKAINFRPPTPCLGKWYIEGKMIYSFLFLFLFFLSSRLIHWTEKKSKHPHDKCLIYVSEHFWFVMSTTVLLLLAREEFSGDKNEYHRTDKISMAVLCADASIGGFRRPSPAPPKRCVQIG